MVKREGIDVLRRVIRYSRPYLGRIALVVCASILVGATDVASAKLVQPLVDKVLQPQDRALIPLVPFFIVLLFAVKGSGKFVQEYCIKTAGALVVQDIRNELYSHCLKLSLGYFNQNTAGNFMSRILNDVGVMQRATADMLVDGIRESVTLVGLLGLAFYNDWKLTSVAFLVLPLAFFPGVCVGRRIKKNSKAGQAVLGDLTAILQETFSGMKIIKSFGTEARERDKFMRENRNFYHFIRNVALYDSLSAPIVEVLASIGVAAVFWFGIYRVINGVITLGQLFSFGTAIIMMYVPLRRLIKLNNTAQAVMGSAERVFEILDHRPDITDAPDAFSMGRARGEVVFDHVHFAYDGQTVLEDFSLHVSPGEVVALVGPSGSGKTTIVSLLLRFYDVQEGCVSIDGHDVRKIASESLRRNVALVDQETFLFNDSVSGNIRYGCPDASEEAVRKAAVAAYADQFIRELPAGYDEIIGDRGVRLSGGQRQRLCIARALLMDAPILVLDEATSALDTESETVVQKALGNLMRNRTTFVIAHRLSTICGADKIVVIDNGRVVEMGSHAELMAARGFYHKLYEFQFAGRNGEMASG
ncbi:MAG: ABC transporter ATP-binding protein [Deltaproteobacteria bacterium]|nr:ABC transporter ATP-binding protein [Deltaproteobacteria bacterium]MBQ7249328.1 ABC transporter ATP-binding protein [Deltaproteobacteria bacterium]